VVGDLPILYCWISPDLRRDLDDLCKAKDASAANSALWLLSDKLMMCKRWLAGKKNKPLYGG